MDDPYVLKRRDGMYLTAKLDAPWSKEQKHAKKFLWRSLAADTVRVMSGAFKINLKVVRLTPQGGYPRKGSIFEGVAAPVYQWSPGEGRAPMAEYRFSNGGIEWRKCDERAAWAWMSPREVRKFAAEEPTFQSWIHDLGPKAMFVFEANLGKPREKTQSADGGH